MNNIANIPGYNGSISSTSLVEIDLMYPEDRDDLLIRIASLYYEHDYSQEEIARTVKSKGKALSRSNISRLLKEAKRKGLVEIRIHKRISTALAMEAEFCQRFDLQKAMIVDQPNSNYVEYLSAAGQLAAWYLEEILHPNTVLAIAWGTGVASAVRALAMHPVLRVEVVQMIGSVGSVDPEIDGPELARVLANKLGGQHHYLPSPLFVDSRATHDTFLQQPAIRRTLNHAREARVALVGIGTTEPEASSFLRAGHLNEKQLQELRAQGAVGETSGFHFDINGRADFDINQRVIALNLSELKRIPQVIAVACGLPKTRAILGVLRGGYVKALATDAITASAVLDEDRKA